MPKRIWIDEDFLRITGAPISILSPWYADKAHKHNRQMFSNPALYPYNSIWSRWIVEAPAQFEITHNIDEADVIVIPKQLDQVSSPEDRLLLTRSIIAARERGLRAIGFWFGDRDCTTGIDGLSIFAQSTRRSQRSGNVETLPAWAADMLEKHKNGVLPAIEETGRATISFCGNSFGAATSTGAKFLRPIRNIGRALLRRTPLSAVHVRAKSIESCLETRELDCRFHLKNIAWRGFTYDGKPGPADLEKDQAAFAENLFSSIYALCVRGEGNFSYRMYEVLSAGRIPVIVDTDTLMPIADSVDWASVSVWVKEPEHTGREVTRHFRNHSLGQLHEIQQKILNIWRTRLRPEVWFPSVLDKR